MGLATRSRAGGSAGWAEHQPGSRCLAQDGSIKLAAIRWLATLGIPYLHLDRDGRLIASAASAGLDVRLRRAQRSPPRPQVARYLRS